MGSICFKGAEAAVDPKALSTINPPAVAAPVPAITELSVSHRGVVGQVAHSRGSQAGFQDQQAKHQEKSSYASAAKKGTGAAQQQQQQPAHTSSQHPTTLSSQQSMLHKLEQQEQQQQQQHQQAAGGWLPPSNPGCYLPYSKVTLSGLCVYIPDGDTLELAVSEATKAEGEKVGLQFSTFGRDSRPRLRVRMAYIDAPESKQESGPEACSSLKEMAMDRMLQAIVVDIDQYGRAVSVLVDPSGGMAGHRSDGRAAAGAAGGAGAMPGAGAAAGGGRVLNYEQVLLGHAWVYSPYVPLDNPLLLQGLQAARDEAQRQKKGLWSKGNPQRPNEWRKQHPRG